MQTAITNIIGTAMAGILSLLWYDIRGVRNETREMIKDFLPEKEIVLLHDCMMLRVEKKIDDMGKKILKEIKNNGNHGGAKSS